ncbi:MAG: hypothetical protein L6R39_005942 [Caloplaca ligustica]|nr:MAG: hypothetical protein L6R39_005942 [Caloplaca ligustica]
MVLETSDSYDAFPDSPDPYGFDPQPSIESMNIDRSKFPKPLPVLGALFGFTASYMSKMAAERLQYHSKLLGRTLSKPESEALLYHTYKSAAIASYGNPIAFGAGFWRAYNTRDTYRFPLVGSLKTEDGFWNGERIRLMGRDIIQGSNARMGVHILRGTFYGFLSYTIGTLFVSSYCTTVAAVGELRDPRLRDLQQEKRTKKIEQMGDSGAARQLKEIMGQAQTNGVDLRKRPGDGIGAQDDATPSTGTEDYGGDMERLGGTNTGIMSDGQMRRQEKRQQAPPRQSPTESRASTSRLEKVERQPTVFGDDFDDASPTAQNSADDSQRGNAWDRIRKQARKQASGTKSGGRGWDAIRKEQQEGSTAGDSFTFSSADEERQLAQDEAQKEFDARVERERQGGNFNENKRRW